MAGIIELFRVRRTWERLSIAVFYGFCLGIALNLFWIPGHISAGGVTGLAQVIAIIFERFLNFNVFGLQAARLMTTANLIFLINVPLFLIAWREIGHSFTIYTLITVLMSSLMINALADLQPLTHDSMVCAIFGAVINGAGIGITRRNNLSSGGTDIVGMVMHKLTGTTVGSVSIVVNAVVIVMTGFLQGWPQALYSVIAIFISGKVMDIVYTRQQRVQVMIVTNQHLMNQVVAAVQHDLRHGITVFKNAEGAYAHESKVVLLTIISRAELYELEAAVQHIDKKAFISSTPVVQIAGKFIEPQAN